jgi:multiple antibiotic resistance protein
VSDYLRLVVAFLAAVNPAWAALAFSGVAPRERRAIAAVGFLTAAAVVAAATGGARALLGFLDLEPETFRIGAGLVMAAAGLVALVPRQAPGNLPAGLAAGVAPLGAPLLAGPATLVAAVSYGADEGRLETFLAALPALVAGAALAAVAPAALAPVLRGLTLVAGGLLVVFGASLVVSGVKAV